MSTISFTVSGPSARLAMLRALALKAASHLRSSWNSIRTTLSITTSTLKTASNLALAAIGSRTGYELITSAARTIIIAGWSGLQWLCSHSSRLLGRVAQSAYTAIASLSPAVARVVEDTIEHYLVEPVLTAALSVDAWMRSIGMTIWALTQTGMVRTTTVISAQIAGGLIAAHVLSKGLLAARIVQLLPATMTAVVWVTNPIIAITAVGAAFLGAAAVALIRLLNTPRSTTAQEAQDQSFGATRIRPFNEVFEAFDGIDLEQIAAALQVEVTPYGSVIVKGIPENLPTETAERIAHIAADAAVKRLVKVLPHRQPNRDDRRVITKVAKEAVRKAA